MITVFALVSSRLINTTLRVHDDAGRVAAESRLLGAAVEQLRRDVWSARGLTLTGRQFLQFDRGDGPAAVWGVGPDGTLFRAERAAGAPPYVPGVTPAGAAERWPGVGGRLSFEWDGAVLTVRGADGGADRAGGLRLASPVHLARRGGAP